MTDFTLVAEADYSDIERDLIENEPPGLFPVDQNSAWGQMRKLYADYLQGNFVERLEDWYLNLDPRTALASDFPEWEEMLGIPDQTGKTDNARRAFISSRREQGPFTRSRRNRIIESFIAATFGVSLSFGSSGILLDAGGAPLLADTVPLPSTYRVYEDVTGRSYLVRIVSEITPDIAGLTRELKRVTPAGISFTIDNSLSGTAILDYHRDVMQDQPVLKLGLGGVATDGSYYANHGTLNGGPVGANSLVPNMPGANRALTFDGVDDFISIPSASQINNITDNFTYELWWRMPAVPAAGTVYYLYYHPGHSVAYIDPSANLVISSGAGYAYKPTALAINTTYHIVIRVRNNVVSMRINNVEQSGLVVSSPGPVFASYPDATYIGGVSATAWANGTMDELAVYNRYLSDARLTSHYNTGMNIL